MEENPINVEIGKAVLGPSGSVPLAFHLRANPVATWKKAVALSPAKWREFVSGTVLPFPSELLSQELIDWFISELSKEAALKMAVSKIFDERLREQLVALASLEGDDTIEIVSNAKHSLEVIDNQKAGPVGLELADTQFMQKGLELQAEGQDIKALVPVLIKILKTSSALPVEKQRMASEVSVQWLEGIVSRSYQSDVSAWEVFWKQNKGKSYCQWLVDAASVQTVSPLLAMNALRRLARCGDEAIASDYLFSRVQHDVGDTQMIAALSLAKHKDIRVIPFLVRMLANSNVNHRAMALVALAYFHTTTLGFDPEADISNRAQALQRWRAWGKTVAN